MSRPSQDEEDSLILESLANLSLEEGINIKRNFCLTPPASPSPIPSEYDAGQEVAIQEAEELERLIETLPQRLATEQPTVTKPQVPPPDDPNYEYQLQAARIYKQWWELPGIDMNDGNNRTRLRSAYYHVAFDSRPEVWEEMTSWDMYLSMYDWDQKLRRNAQDTLALATYSIRNQALLKQLPSSLSSAGLNYIFCSSGRVRNVHSPSDFCQGKLETYDVENLEENEQYQIELHVDDYIYDRGLLQKSGEFVYRHLKRFHDGCVKETDWTTAQPPNPKLRDTDAYKANAITHLRLTTFRTPDYTPYPPPPPPKRIPVRKYARLRGPSSRAKMVDAKEKVMAEYYRDWLLTAYPLGAPGRPNARIR